MYAPRTNDATNKALAYEQSGLFTSGKEIDGPNSYYACHNTKGDTVITITTPATFGPPVVAKFYVVDKKLDENAVLEIVNDPYWAIRKTKTSREYGEATALFDLFELAHAAAKLDRRLLSFEAVDILMDAEAEIVFTRALDGAELHMCMFSEHPYRKVELFTYDKNGLHRIDDANGEEVVTFFTNWLDGK